MFAAFSQKLEKYFDLWMILSLAAGFLFPRIFIPLVPYLTYFLGFLMFFSVLRLDLNDLFKYLKKPLLIIYLVFLVLIISPLITYFVFHSFIPEYILGFVLLAAAPPAISSPVISSILKGNLPLSFAVSFLGNLLCPFTIPLIITLLFGVSLEINSIDLFFFLSQVILIPLFAAFLCQKLLPKAVSKTKAGLPGLSICLIVVVIAASIAPQASSILEKLKTSFSLLVIIFIFTIFLYLIGFFALPKTDFGTRLSSMIALVYINGVLIQVTALKYFDPLTLMVIILQIPIRIFLLVPLSWLSRYYFKKI